jgi:hypothetical protein
MIEFKQYHTTVYLPNSSSVGRIIPGERSLRKEQKRREAINKERAPLVGLVTPIFPTMYVQDVLVLPLSFHCDWKPVLYYNQKSHTD